MLEIRSILAPTDFSSHSELAVKYACGLAERLGAELHLLNVVSELLPVGPDPLLMPMMPPEYYTEIEGQSLERMAKLPDPAWGQPASVVRAVRLGSPVEMIVAYASELHISMVVIATHGRTGLGHVILGSVAERIVREAPCPVLTIRERKLPG